MRRLGNIVIQAVSGGYENNEFRTIYTPAKVISPPIGGIVTTRNIVAMVANGYAVTILPSEEED